jgi:hypothetical protein
MSRSSKVSTTLSTRPSPNIFRPRSTPRKQDQGNRHATRTAAQTETQGCSRHAAEIEQNTLDDVARIVEVPL